MKKIFTVLSVLLLIAFGAGQAIGGAVGTMDDVLAPDVFAPFFLVDRTLTAPQENTLIVYQEMRGFGTAAAPTIYHGFVYDINSNLVFDWFEPGLTPWDVDQFYVSDILSLMPALTLAALEVTVDGTAYYGGYIVLDNQTFPATNHVGGWVYQVNLNNGKASASKLPSREWALGAANTNQGASGTTAPGTAYGQRQQLSFTATVGGLTGGVSTMPGIDLAAQAGGLVDYPVVAAVGGSVSAVQAAAIWSDMEGFSPNAFAIATQRTFGFALNGPLTNPVATWNLFPRYLLMDSNSATYFFIWTNLVRAGYSKHVNVYDEDENVLSLTIPLANELNIINARDYVPPGFITGSGDYGFFDFYWTAADVLNPIDNTVRAQDWVVYSYQMATGAAGQSWNVLERGFTHVGT